MNSTYKYCTLLDERFLNNSEFTERKHIHVYLFLITALDGLLIIPTILLNITAAKTILKSSKLKEKPCFFLILVQSVLDTAVGAIVLPLYTFGLATQAAGVPNCWVTFLGLVITLIFSICSYVTLIVMTFERYMGIFHPLIHRTKVTKRRLLKSIIFLSPVAFILNIASNMFAKGEYNIIGDLITLIFVAFTAFVYTRIFAFARKRFRVSKRARDGEAKPTSSEKKENRKFLQETKLAKSCFLVVACSMICYFPTSFTFLYDDMDIFTMNVFLAFLLTIVLLNSSLNSIIFFWRNPILRRNVKSNLRSRK